MSDEIKPCPFCGNDKAPRVASCIDVEVCEAFIRCDSYDEAVCVVCDYQKGGCGASGSFQDTPEAAIDAWNTRAERTCNNANCHKPATGTFDVGGRFECS